MSEMEKVHDGLAVRGIAFIEPIPGSNHTWLNCAGCKTSLIQHEGTIDIICYGMTAEQALAFVDVMESK